jgi:hypothetical protein
MIAFVASLWLPCQPLMNKNGVSEVFEIEVGKGLSTIKCALYENCGQRYFHSPNGAVVSE